jgi:DNA-binding MarR family transcriptional regulator
LFDVGQWRGPGVDVEGAVGDLLGQCGQFGEDFAGGDGTLPAADDLEVGGAVAADNELSLTQLRVLATLRDRRLRMTVLAGYLGLEKSTMTGLVDRAEKRGLLQRAPNVSDGRAVDVFLSPEWAELAGRLYTHIARALSPMTSKLTSAQQRLLQTLLEQMLSPHDS